MQFITKPNSQELAARSREFFLAAVKRSESDLASARVRLDDAEGQYDTIDTPSWGDEQMLAKAQDHLDRCESVHRTNTLKLTWEADSQWKRVIKTSKKFTIELLSAVPWKDIFRARS